MKTHTETTGNGLGKTVNLLSLFLVLFLLTACGNSKLDRVMSMAAGNIDKEVVISANELESILKKHFGRIHIEFSGATYVLPDNGKVAQINDYAHCNPMADKRTKPKGWDCDDYAMAAMGPMRNYAFGVMYVKTESGTKHALNVYVNRNKEVKYWEPQTCNYYQGLFHKPELIVF